MKLLMILLLKGNSALVAPFQKAGGCPRHETLFRHPWCILYCSLIAKIVLVCVHALYALSAPWKSCFARFTANNRLRRGALVDHRKES